MSDKSAAQQQASGFNNTTWQVASALVGDKGMVALTVREWGRYSKGRFDLVLTPDHPDASLASELGSGDYIGFRYVESGVSDQAVLSAQVPGQGLTHFMPYLSIERRSRPDDDLTGDWKVTGRVTVPDLKSDKQDKRVEATLVAEEDGRRQVISLSLGHPAAAEQCNDKAPPASWTLRSGNLVRLSLDWNEDFGDCDPSSMSRTTIRAR